MKQARRERAALARPRHPEASRGEGAHGALCVCVSCVCTVCVCGAVRRERMSEGVWDAGQTGRSPHPSRGIVLIARMSIDAGQIGRSPQPSLRQHVRTHDTHTSHCHCLYNRRRALGALAARTPTAQRKEAGPGIDER